MSVESSEPAASTENSEGEGEGLGEEEDDLDAFYKRKLFDPAESDGSAWDGQRKDILQLLKCEPKEGTVFGWCLYEILASIGGTENLLVDNDIRQLLFSHIIQVQHLFFYKLERKHLLETRPIAIFMAKTLFQGLFSTSYMHMLEVLVNQKLGFFPLLLMHVDADDVHNFLDALMVQPKPPGLTLLIATALCGELKFHSTRTIQKLQVERLLGLLGSVYEDTKEDSLVFKDIATVIEPLADFVVNLTTTSECEVVSLHLVNLRYSRSVATSVPNFVKALTRHTRQLVSVLKSETKPRAKNGENNPQRRIQLQVLDLLMSLIKTHDPGILKTLEFYSHVEQICDALYNQLECPIFFNMGVIFIQCVLATRRTTLITPKLIESIVNIFKLNDTRRVYIDAFIREIYPIPTYNQHFPSEVVKVMSTSRTRGASLIGMTQAEKLEKKIEALTKNMQQSNGTHTADTQTSNHSGASHLSPAVAPVATTPATPAITLSPPASQTTPTPSTSPSSSTTSLTPPTSLRSPSPTPGASSLSPSATASLRSPSPSKQLRSPSPTPAAISSSPSSLTSPISTSPISPASPIPPTSPEFPMSPRSSVPSSSTTDSKIDSKPDPIVDSTNDSKIDSTESKIDSKEKRNSRTDLKIDSKSDSKTDLPDSKGKSHHKKHHKRDKEKDKEKEKDKDKDTKNTLKKKAWSSTYAAYAQSANSASKTQLKS